MMRRRLLALLIVLCMGMSVLACPSAVFGTTAKTAVSWKTAMTKTEEYIGKQLTKPAYGSEWVVTAMARDGGALNYDAYYKDVVSQVKSSKGVLDARKALPYTKVILALTAMGKDPQNVGGYNLLEGLADYDKVMLTGTNGPVFALLALDCGKYEVPAAPAGKTQTTRELLVDTILERELDGGGFTVGMASSGAETDITAMAVQALAPYRDRDDVAAAIDRALTVLSKKQGSDGCFSDYGTKSAESIAQVMIALMAVGRDPAADADFVKKGNSLLDALMKFYDKGGGFRHVLKTTAGYDAKVDGMATEQGYMALGTYKRFLAGENFVYDMTDGVKKPRPVKVEKKAPAKVKSLALKSPKKKQLKVSWKKVSGAKGYQIRYATNKSFKNSKTVTVSSKYKTKTLKKLKSGKRYYVKVRAYTKSGSKKIYGAYSAVKYLKVK